MRVPVQAGRVVVLFAALLVAGCPGSSSGGGNEFGDAGSYTLADASFLDASVVYGACTKSSECEPWNWCAGITCDSEGICVSTPTSCSETIMPVCGCNDVTYINPCYAEVAGSRIATLGPCTAQPDAGNPDSCGTSTCTAGQACCESSLMCYDPTCTNCCKGGSPPCASNRDCDTGQYCGGIGCGTEGTCETTPVKCPGTYEPVCGCDGNTYPNSCFADQAGIRVFEEGACASTTPDGGPDAGGDGGPGSGPDGGGDAGTDAGSCSSNSECPPDSAGTVSYCALSSCAPPGVCEPRTQCDGIGPVCGCDDVTYATDCQAAKTGVSVAHIGACEANNPDGGTTCKNDSDCPSTQFCAAPLCEGAGVCIDRPETCTPSLVPVCGCNNLTYGSLCFAEQAGERVASEVACQTAFDAGTCQTITGCPIVGEVCCPLTDHCEPVGCTDCCGDNGDGGVDAGRADAGERDAGRKDGGNESDGGVADAGSHDAGPNDAGSRTCTTNAECSTSVSPEAEYCDGTTCTDEGTCVVRPAMCSDVFSPVCGCNDVTYSNACEAAAAGVRVNYSGSCNTPPDAGPGVDAGNPSDGGQDGGLCGESNEPCCNGSECLGELVCRAGTCQPLAMCGGLKEPCCDVDTCDPGFACVTGICEPQETSDAGVDAGPMDAGGRPCMINADCNDDPTTNNAFYCNGETCTDEGTCTPLPTSCSSIIDPVCGCNNATYANACEAAASGVRVAYDGPCDVTPDAGSAPDSGSPQPDSGIGPRDGGHEGNDAGNETDAGTPEDAGTQDAGGRPCSDNDQCISSNGTASEYCAGETCSGEGTCVQKPTSCDNLFDPVCGCNDVTYANACYAAMAGIRVSSSGICVDGGVPDAGNPNEDAGQHQDAGTPDAGAKDAGAKTCLVNADCADPTTAETMYCDGDTCMGEGVCVERPQVCSALVDPVCGCNGVTYGNACLAAQAGERVFSSGECASEDAGTMGMDAGTRDAGSAKDGGTGANDAGSVKSDAGAEDAGHADAGADAGHADAGTACTSNSQCSSSSVTALEYCSGSTCNGPGTCTTRPTDCSDEYDPVCGCNGDTYANACTAEERGIRVDYTGVCGSDVDGGASSDASVCPIWPPQPCGVIELCECEDGTRQTAGCVGPPTCEDACCGHGGSGTPDAGVTTSCTNGGGCPTGDTCCRFSDTCYRDTCTDCCLPPAGQ